MLLVRRVQDSGVCKCLQVCDAGSAQQGPSWEREQLCGSWNPRTSARRWTGPTCLLDPVTGLSRACQCSAAALCSVPRPRLSLTRHPFSFSVLVRHFRYVPDLCLHQGTLGPISSERRLLSAGVLPVFPEALLSFTQDDIFIC